MQDQEENEKQRKESRPEGLCPGFCPRARAATGAKNGRLSSAGYPEYSIIIDPRYCPVASEAHGVTQ